MCVLYTSRVSRARGSLSTVTEKRELYRVWSSFFVLSVAFNLRDCISPCPVWKDTLVHPYTMREASGRCKPHTPGSLHRESAIAFTKPRILKWGWDEGTSKGRFTKMRRAQFNSRSPPLSFSPLHRPLPRSPPSWWRPSAVPAYVDDYRDET